MSETINGYLLEEPLKTDNSGFSKWGFGKRNGKTYFIKEFLSPVYPVDVELLGPELTKKKREICSNFVAQKCLLFRAMNEASDGNLVHIEQFFRCGSRYYITMEKVDAVELPRVLSLPLEEKIRICMILAHAVDGMHQAGLVHSDIKLNNVIFCRTGGGRIGARIIDLDSSFWETQPPRSEDEIIGDQIYMAPETFHLIAQEEGALDRKIDVFALGLLFHQILTGILPGFDEEIYHYPYEALLDGKRLEVAFLQDGEISETIGKMLQRAPEERPELKAVWELLRERYRERSRQRKAETAFEEGFAKKEKRRRKDEFFFQAGEEDL